MPLLRVKDKAAKAAYDRARYLARYVDRRRASCVACGGAVQQPRHGYRLYCEDACKTRAWHAAHPVVHPSTREDMPMPYVGAALFEEARRIARVNGVSDFGNDVLGEVVLALCEGRDAREAARAFRAREAGHAAATLRLDMGGVGLDGHGNVVVEHEEAA